MSLLDLIAYLIFETEHKLIWHIFQKMSKHIWLDLHNIKIKWNSTTKCKFGNKAKTFTRSTLCGPWPASPNSLALRWSLVSIASCRPYTLALRWLLVSIASCRPYTLALRWSLVSITSCRPYTLALMWSLVSITSCRSYNTCYLQSY